MVKKKGYIWQLPTSNEPGLLMQDDGTLVEFYTELADPAKDKELDKMFREMRPSRAVFYLVDEKGKAKLLHYVK